MVTTKEKPNPFACSYVIVYINSQVQNYFWFVQCIFVLVTVIEYNLPFMPTVSPSYGYSSRGIPQSLHLHCPKAYCKLTGK